MFNKLSKKINEDFYTDNAKEIVCEMLNDFKIGDIYLILKNDLIFKSYNNIKCYDDILLRIISESDLLFDGKDSLYKYIEKCNKNSLIKEGWRIYGNLGLCIDLKGLNKIKYNTKRDAVKRELNYLSGKCVGDKCHKKIYSNGLCKFHYFEERAKVSASKKNIKSSICFKENCKSKVFSGGLCKEHYDEFLKELGKNSK